MRKIIIQDLVPGLVPGIVVQMPGTNTPYEEDYFAWTDSSLISSFQTKNISGGILLAREHTPVFSVVETHIDAEMFYFVSGVAIMPFMEVKDGQPDMETAQIVRIQPGTQIIIPPGKAHFVAVAEGEQPVDIIVVAPKMDAPRISLPEKVMGIY